MEEIYREIVKILKSSAKKHNLLTRSSIFNSEAKVLKPQLHLYGRKEVEIMKRPKQPTYIAGVMLHKNYVGYYSMGVYGFAKEYKLSPQMKKVLKGKSCFQIRDMDPQTKKEITEITEKTVQIFKRKGWL